MAYKPDLKSAANRHYVDGQTLMERKRFDNAGYHFGLAAECAVKQRLLGFDVPQNDPAIWKHWPELRTLASLALSGRTGGPMLALLQDGNFMRRWDIKMRYSNNGSVTEKQVKGWSKDANAAIGLLL
jgi:hypothetical protein